MFAKLDRRRFLRTSAVAVAGTAVAGSEFLAAPDGAWAMTVTTLGKAAAATLIRMARDLFPHDSIGDTAYAKVVEKLDRRAGADQQLAGLLKDGVTALDAAAKEGYAAASEARRIAILASMETTPFFQTVRVAMAKDFYNDEAVWKALGYEGSSAEFGGYLHRGFDDIDWLPRI